MDKCSHQDSPKKDWLPISNGAMKQHPFCQKCGIVRNISSDRGKDVGYFINSLAELTNYLEMRGYRISKAQKRLIIKEFEENGFGDSYSITFSSQKKGFTEIVVRHVKVSKYLVENFV
ncbi:MAG: hypothetical protein H0Z28_12800 [Archaeoglobus sp.]|nr:hypothetical protein [Archaeoglobus sp.]